MAGGRQGQPQCHVFACQGGQRVEGAAGLASVAGDLGHALLLPVELFQHDHRQVDIVFLESEQTHRVMQ
jgi:hypothetical protein